MKKNLTLVVAVVIIIGIVFSMPSEIITPTVVATSGYGDGESVQDIDEFSQIFEFLSAKSNQLDSLYAGDSSITLLSANSNRDESDIDYIDKHESVTFFENVVLETSYKYQKPVYSGGNYYNPSYTYKDVSLTKSKLSRQLTIYIDGDKSYYVSKGYHTSNYYSYEDSSSSSNTVAAFEFEMYLDNDTTVFKFDRFNYHTDYSDAKKEGYSIEFGENGLKFRRNVETMFLE